MIRLQNIKYLCFIVAIISFNYISAATFTVINTNNSGAGSLRQAIIDSNTAGGSNIINFNIPGAGPFVISPTSALPTITTTVTIDGTTQPGFVNTPIIELDGSSSGFSLGGLVVFNLNSNNSVVRGLVIRNFNQAGILIIQSNNNLIENNFIGTDITGTIAHGNGTHGIFLIASNGTIIGGTNKNLISANFYSGISVNGSNNVQTNNNFIGTDITGNTALGNARHGIEILNNSDNIIITNNLISGNQASGIKLGYPISLAHTTNNTVTGNIIGTNITTTAAIANGENGIEISGTSTGNIIGGFKSAFNIISGNTQNGVAINEFASSNTVSGNLIGTNISGDILPNGQSGILLGLTQTGTMNNNIIGGSTTNNGNIITNNGSSGVGVLGLNNRNIGNSILSNSIFGNVGIGIDLNNDGVTLNHPTSPTPGPNEFQNYPVLCSALFTSVNGGSVVIVGILNSVPNTKFKIQFFHNDTHIPGKTEGKDFIGETEVTTNSSGNARFSIQFSVTKLLSNFISATATRLNGPNDTSEFSFIANISPIVQAIINKYCI